jgi:hypothetical protein
VPQNRYCTEPLRGNATHSLSTAERGLVVPTVLFDPFKRISIDGVDAGNGILKRG